MERITDTAHIDILRRNFFNGRVLDVACQPGRYPGEVIGTVA